MGYRISVIDDSQVFRNVVQSLLQEEGYEVDVVTAAPLAATQVAAFQPDLIMVDLRMDGVETGLALLDTLRADPMLAAVPLVACSADTVTLDAHEDDFRRAHIQVLEKPFDLDDLLSLLTRLLPKT